MQVPLVVLAWSHLRPAASRIRWTVREPAMKLPSVFDVDGMRGELLLTLALSFPSPACLAADNRYWTMWKLPMFGCTDPGQVLQEVDECTRAFPNAYIRLVAFDATRQVQVTGE